MYSGFLRVAERCATCDLDLTGEDAGDGAAVFVIFVVGFAVVGLALVAEILFGPPLWVHYAVWIPAILGASMGLLRPFKGVLIALQFKHRSVSGGNAG
ncbi:MAG TPA: DUF983 domain-containing protein [Alphaproteobacteria bacterium]|nr:DUF983 domain-containing protein [Alphaproteobacteria bacterium]